MVPNPIQIGYPIRIGSAAAAPTADATTSPSANTAITQSRLIVDLLRTSRSSRPMGRRAALGYPAEADVTRDPGGCQCKGGARLLHEGVIHQIARRERTAELPGGRSDVHRVVDHPVERARAPERPEEPRVSGPVVELHTRQHVGEESRG